MSRRRGTGAASWIVRFLLGLGMLAAVVWLVCLLGRAGVDQGWFAGIDRFSIQARPDHFLTSFFKGVTWLGTVTGVVAVSALMLVILLAGRLFRGAAALLASLLTSAYANDFIKEWVARERPEHLGIVDPQGYSYLSGHAFVCTAVFGLFAFILIRAMDGRGAKWATGVTSVALLALIGFSRIYLGVHYTSDVLLGFALGLVWMAVWALVFRLFGQAGRR